VRDQRLVPEKLEEKSPEKDENHENDRVIKALPGVSRLHNGKHFIIFGDNNGGRSQGLHEFPSSSQVWVGAGVHI
jgi:hypothetical protein